MLEHVGIAVAGLMEDLLQKGDEELNGIVKNFKQLWLSKADY